MIDFGVPETAEIPPDHPGDKIEQFVELIRQYVLTDKDRFLNEAMKLRIQLINSEEQYFTASYLDGLMDGMRFGLNGPNRARSGGSGQ